MECISHRRRNERAHWQTNERRNDTVSFFIFVITVYFSAKLYVNAFLTTFFWVFFLCILKAQRSCCASTDNLTWSSMGASGLSWRSRSTKKCRYCCCCLSCWVSANDFLKLDTCRRLPHSQAHFHIKWTACQPLSQRPVAPTTNSCQLAACQRIGCTSTTCACAMQMSVPIVWCLHFIAAEKSIAVFSKFFFCSIFCRANR